MTLEGFQHFLSWLTPVAVAALSGAMGYVLRQFGEIRREQTIQRKEHADDLIRLASQAVSRKEFEQLEKRIDDHSLHVRDALAEIKNGIARIHERIDESKK